MLQRAGTTLLGVPVRLVDDGLAGTGETVNGNVGLFNSHPRQVLASLGPAVVKKHCLASIKHRRYLLDPPGAELRLHRVDDRRVRRCDLRMLVFDAEFAQQRAGSRHEGVGDFLAIRLERGGVHHATTGATACRRPADNLPMCPSHLLNCRVDQRVDLSLGGGGRQGGQ